jgi:hypothetical protein
MLSHHDRGDDDDGDQRRAGTTGVSRGSSSTIEAISAAFGSIPK